MSKTIEIQVKNNADRTATDFASLRKEIKATEDSVAQLTKEFGENSAEATAAAQKLGDLNKAYTTLSKSSTDLTANFEQMYGELQPLSSRLGEIEDRLYELALAGKSNTQEFKDLQIEGARFRQTIIDVDKGIDLLAENRGLGVIAGGLGQIGDQLSNLDFQGAAQSAKLLTANIKAMDPKTVMAGFKALTQTIGQLGNAFFQMGLKLLANPIFLIVAVIAAVVIAIVLLKDKIKPLQEAFDVLMIPIKALIQGLKDLSDWLGLTTFAEDEAAEKSIKAAEKRLKAAEQTGNLLQDQYARQIALAKAQGKETTELEIDAAKAQVSTGWEKYNELAKQVEATKLLIKNSGADKKKEYQSQLNDLIVAKNAEVKVIKDSSNEVKVIEAGAAKKAEDEAKKAAEKSKADKDKAEKDRLAREKEYAEKRIATARMLKDLEINAMDEGLAKELAKNAEAEKRKIEDVKRDGKLLNSERIKLIEAFAVERAKADKKAMDDEAKRIKEANDKKIEEEKKFQADMKAAQQQFDDFIIENTGTEFEKQMRAIKNKYDKERDELKKHLEQKLISQEEYNNKVQQLNNAQYNEQDKARADFFTKEQQDSINRIQQFATAAQGLLGALGEFFNQADEQRISQIESSNEKQNALLDSKLQRDLAAAGNNEAAKTAIQKKYDQQKYQNDLKANKQVNELKKKQFNRDKAFRIANAVMDTGSAVVNALASAPPPASYALAAIAGAIGAVQIATIASQKFEGEAGPAAPSGSGGIGGGGSSAPSAPNFTLNGQGGTGGEARQGETVEQRIAPIDVRVNISEAEITDTQNRVARIQRNSEL